MATNFWSKEFRYPRLLKFGNYWTFHLHLRVLGFAVGFTTPLFGLSLMMNATSFINPNMKVSGMWLGYKKNRVPKQGDLFFQVNHDWVHYGF